MAVHWIVTQEEETLHSLLRSSGTELFKPAQFYMKDDIEMAGLYSESGLLMIVHWLHWGNTACSLIRSSGIHSFSIQ